VQSVKREVREKVKELPVFQGIQIGLFPQKGNKKSVCEYLLWVRRKTT